MLRGNGLEFATLVLLARDAARFVLLARGPARFDRLAGLPFSLVQ